MPITFGELVQEVINEVRAREQFQQLAQKQEARIKELEGQLAEVAIRNAATDVQQRDSNIVRLPDKPSTDSKQFPKPVTLKE